MLNENLTEKNIEKAYQEKYSVNTDSTNRLTRTILQRAMDLDIPLNNDHDLIKMLAQLESKQSLPREFYKAVGDIVSYINEVDKRIGGRTNA